MEKIKNMLDEQLPNIISFALLVVLCLVCFVIGRIAIGWIRKLMRKSLEKTQAEQAVIKFIDSIVKVSLHIILVLAIAIQVGIEPASVAALFTSASVAIGLAIQGSLSNLAGGVLILVLKPFSVGDYIIEDTHKNEGVVKEIQIFYTKLQTVDNKIIVVPNGTLANTSLTNITGQDMRRLDFQVHVAYNTDLKKAKQVLDTLLDNCKAILKDKERFVVVEELGESSIAIGVKAWVSTDDYWTTRWDLLEKVKSAMDEANIEIPYNQLDVNIRSEGDL